MIQAAKKYLPLPKNKMADLKKNTNNAPTMRDINLGTCATIVGTTTVCTPLPPSNVEICLCHTASSGHLCFSTLLGGRGALGSGERGTWECIGSFFKSSKDLLRYSMLFLEMSQVFLTSIVVPIALRFSALK